MPRFLNARFGNREDGVSLLYGTKWRGFQSTGSVLRGGYADSMESMGQRAHESRVAFDNRALRCLLDIQLWRRDSHIAFGVEAKGLPQLKAMLANCDFFFGNEGGPRHLAQALGVPSFAIYPPHISKTVWLPSNGGMHQGIEVADIESSRLLDKKADYAERFALVTVEEVWNRLAPHADHYLKKQ